MTLNASFWKALSLDLFPFPGSEIVKSAELRKREHWKKEKKRAETVFPPANFSRTFQFRVFSTIWEPGTGYWNPCRGRRTFLGTLKVIWDFDWLAVWTVLLQFIFVVLQLINVAKLNATPRPGMLHTRLLCRHATLFAWRHWKLLADRTRRPLVVTI